PRSVALLHRCDVQPRGHLTEAARAVRGRLAHRAAPAQRVARAYSRRAERGRHAPRGRRGDFSASDLWGHAGGGGRAGGLRPGPDRARGALPAWFERAGAAGGVAMRYYRTGFDVTMKHDATPVTEADRGAERVIREVIGRAFPAHGFLG